MDTAIWDEANAKFAKWEKFLVGEAIRYGRMGHPEDMVGAAIFLASEEADYIMAQTLNVDDGNWMS